MSGMWQLQAAKANLSKLVDQALREGPQVITRHGKAAAVVISADEYAHLSGQKTDFKTFLRQAPLYELDLTRSRDAGRDVDL